MQLCRFTGAPTPRGLPDKMGDTPQANLSRLVHLGLPSEEKCYQIGARGQPIGLLSGGGKIGSRPRG